MMMTMMCTTDNRLLDDEHDMIEITTSMMNTKHHTIPVLYSTLPSSHIIPNNNNPQHHERQLPTPCGYINVCDF